MKFNIQLEPEQLQKVIDGLVTRPYNEVFQTIETIKTQYEQQTAPDSTPNGNLEPLNG